MEKPSEKQPVQNLTPEQHHVMREEGTERPFSSDLNQEKREGVYRCASCGTELFDSSAKYESGSGWPSFYEAKEGSLGFKTDRKMLVARTEYHCAKCGGHLGHVFDDGPMPSGKRFCTNGVALCFNPEKTEG